MAKVFHVLIIGRSLGGKYCKSLYIKGYRRKCNSYKVKDMVKGVSCFDFYKVKDMAKVFHV